LKTDREKGSSNISSTQKSFFWPYEARNGIADISVSTTPRATVPVHNLNMSTGEGSFSPSSVSDEDLLANSGFFTPIGESKSDDGERIIRNGENEAAPTNSVLGTPSPIHPRAILAEDQSVGSPLRPNPDVVAAMVMPGHPEVRQASMFPNFPSEAQLDEGYDSDGFQDCCRDAIEEEGPQDFDEDEILAYPPGVWMNFEATIHQEEEDEGHEEVDDDNAMFVDIPKAELDKMTVATLKAELGRRGVTAKGKKAELKARLIDALARMVKALPEGMVKARGNVLGGFAATAYWSQLKPRDDAIPEPVNAFRGARAPTVPADETEKIAAKFDFGEMFVRGDFEGTYRCNVLHRNGRAKTDASGAPVTESVPLKYGGPNPVFIKKHGLNIASRPVDWFAPFMQRRREKKEAHKFHIGQWCIWTNMKAQFMNAGQPGFLYPDFTPFTVAEIEMFLGLFIFNGLSPSPRIDQNSGL
jgi:hypothetical protein